MSSDKDIYKLNKNKQTHTLSHSLIQKQIKRKMNSESMSENFSIFKYPKENESFADEIQSEIMINNSFSIMDELEQSDEANCKIKELQARIQELEIEMNALRCINKQLEETNKTIQQKSMNYNRFLNRQTLLRERYMFCISFLQTCGNYSCLYGSMVRKLFEIVFRSQNLEQNNAIADPLNSDINILFNYQNSPDKITVSNAYYNLLYTLDSTRIASEKKNSGIETPTFAGYKLTGINNMNFITLTGESVPRAKLIFNKANDTIQVDFMGWKFKEMVDFSINNFFITNISIQGFHNYNFLHYLENINYGETRYLFRPDILQQLAFPEHTIIPRSEKIIHLNKLYKLIFNRLIRVLNSDYKIIQHNPITIETKEECDITGIKPKYPMVTLQCGHKLSIMAYKGILYQTNDVDTQALRCPYCRKDLKITFDDSIHGHSTKYQMLNINNILKEFNINQSLNDSKYICKEAIEYLQSTPTQM
jgi:hypothetical protein